MSHDIGTLDSGVAFTDPHASTRNPTANPISPSPNLAGIDGLAFRRPSQTQSHPNTGASTTIMIGLMFWNQPAGISQPKMVRRVSSLANRLSDDPACSKPDQNAAASRNSQKITSSRFFSSAVWLPNIHR